MKYPRKNMLAVRFSDAELAILRAAAEQADRVPSDYMRYHTMIRARLDLQTAGVLEEATDE